MTDVDMVWVTLPDKAAAPVIQHYLRCRTGFWKLNTLHEYSYINRDYVHVLILWHVCWLQQLFVWIFRTICSRKPCGEVISVLTIQNQPFVQSTSLLTYNCIAARNYFTTTDPIWKPRCHTLPHQSSKCCPCSQGFKSGLIYLRGCSLLRN